MLFVHVNVEGKGCMAFRSTCRFQSFLSFFMRCLFILHECLIINVNFVFINMFIRVAD